MRKHFRFGFGLSLVTTAIFAVGAFTTPPADADTSTTPALDSVVQTYFGVDQLNIAPEILNDLGKNDGSWWICRLQNVEPSIGYGKIVSDNYSDSLLYTSYTYTGETTPKPGALRVRLCSDTQTDGTLYNVGVNFQMPIEPILSVYRMDNRCWLNIKGQDTVLNPFVQLWGRVGAFHDYYYPSYAKSNYMFTRKAPRTVWLSTEFYGLGESGHFHVYGTQFAKVRTDKCSMTFDPNPVKRSTH